MIMNYPKKEKVSSYLWRDDSDMNIVELRNIGLSQQVWNQLHSVGIQKEAPPLETIEMTLMQHFGMQTTLIVEELLLVLRDALFFKKNKSFQHA